MTRKLLVFLIIAAVLFCTAGSLAEDSGGDDSSDDSGSSPDDSSGDSGTSSDDSQGISGPDESSGGSSDDDNVLHVGGSSRSDSSGVDDSPDSGDSSGVDDSPGSGDSSGIDDSPGSGDSSGIDDSPDSGDSSGVDDSAGADDSRRETETSIEQGIAAITSQESRLLEAADGSPEVSPDSSERAAIALAGLTALTVVPGDDAPQLGSMASSIAGSQSRLMECEQTIAGRNGIITFLFGGDDVTAAEIEKLAGDDMATLGRMEQVLDNPAASPALSGYSRARIATVRSELQRLQALAAAEKQKTGILG